MPQSTRQINGSREIRITWYQIQQIKKSTYQPVQSSSDILEQTKTSVQFKIKLRTLPVTIIRHF